jgi:hypothetical protein
MKVLVATCLVLGLTATSAWAGSPHFVGTPKVTQSGSTLSVSGKVAGLGNETQIHVEFGGSMPEPGSTLRPTTRRRSPPG